MSGSQQLLLAAIQQALPDPNFEYTTLLLPGNGTNGAQNNTFLDSSTNNFTITRNGNTTQGTFSPFSQTGWGNYFGGSADYLSIADNTAFNFGTGDATVEFWFNSPGTSNNYPGIISSVNYNTAGSASIRFDNTGYKNKVFMYINSGGDPVIASTSTISYNTWTHVAITRSGTSLKMYINGTLDTTVTISASLGWYLSYGGMRIGRGFDVDGGNAYFPGYVSNIRLVKGSVVYTSNFTPPTTPLTAITNTSLLTCQSNRFVDNSSNAFAITANGSPTVQAFSPFNPTAAWSAATYGGSGYFDGSGDYVSAATASALQLTSAVAWTIEFWFYANAMSSQQFLLHGYDPNPPYTGYGIGLGTNGNPNTTLAFWDGTTWRTIATGLTPSQWYHVAISYEGSGTTGRMFLNGTQQGSAFAPASTINNTSNAIAWGAQNNNILHLNGYISGARIVKGTAVYTASFTAPTAPPTAITNTSLLLNFTNAGIYDATSKNDLETVGNAQISTTQSKFGGSSMYFDGTGDYLVCNAATNNLYAFGTGDFTLEMWVYFNSVASGSLFEFRPASTNGAYPLIYFSSSGVLTYYANSNPQINSSSVSTGQWYHIALCRYGTATKMYLNGIQTGSTYTDSSNYLCRANGPLIGVTSSLSSDFLNGYVDDFRITKGIARYTANFTAPTTAFPLL